MIPLPLVCIIGFACFLFGWFLGYRNGERDGRRGYLDE